MGDGLLVVISGPSGSGKTTIARAVEHRLDGTFSVSATTRPQADGEAGGRDYRFLSEQEFQKLIDDDALLEYASAVRPGRFESLPHNGLHRSHTLEARCPFQKQARFPAQGWYGLLEIPSARTKFNESGCC